MKKFMALLIAAVIIFGDLLSCTDDSNPTGLVEENGLTHDINEMVPDSLLDIIKNMDMPIYRGGNPPTIEGSYLSTPFTLINSNRDGDNIGSTYSDYYLKFSNQNDKELTINIDYKNGGETGYGIGGFIVGEDNNFSVFSKLTVVVNADTAYILNLVSGELQNDGIKDFHLALFMLDNQGNPSGYYINNGEGRIFKDSDGMADKIDSFARLAKSIKTNLKNSLSVK